MNVAARLLMLAWLALACSCGKSAPTTPDIAPTVTITQPVPSPFFTQTLRSDFTVAWRSHDPDGPGSTVKSYRYRLISQHDPIFQDALVHPDILLGDSPGFVGWTKVDGRVGSADFHGVAPGSYLFAITAMDRWGVWDPGFEHERNLKFFIVNNIAPSLGISNGGETPSSARGH